MAILCTECGSANVIPMNEETNDFMCIECGAEFQPAGKMIVKDSNGNELVEGDSVVLIKTLDVKGSTLSLSKGLVVKNIHIIADDAENIECKVEGQRLVLKTCFLKKG